MMKQILRTQKQDSPKKYHDRKRKALFKSFPVHLNGLDKLFLTCEEEQMIDKAVKQMSTTDTLKCKEWVRLGDEIAGGFLCASLYILEFL